MIGTPIHAASYIFNILDPSYLHDRWKTSNKGIIMSLSPQDIMGSWVHSHEEDPKDASLREVYRPSDWNFGPSRGRRGYDLQEGNLASVQGIRPADGLIETEARWWLESGNVLVILEPGGAIRRMRVEEVGPDRLVLRELLDSN